MSGARNGRHEGRGGLVVELGLQSHGIGLSVIDIEEMLSL